MSAKLFKPEDKVRIKKDVGNGFNASGCNFISSMEEYKDKVLTIYRTIKSGNRYEIVEDHGRWVWDDEFFEPAKKNIFDESNVVLLANGEIRLVHEDRLYLPNYTSIGCEVYEGRKHSFDSNFDIVEVHEKATGNYLFELSGELIKEEE